MERRFGSMTNYDHARAAAGDFAKPHAYISDAGYSADLTFATISDVRALLGSGAEFDSIEFVGIDPFVLNGAASARGS